MRIVTLDDARQSAHWERGELVSTHLGTTHAIVRGRGPDVLLLHGVTDNAHTWHALQARLADVARTHALDLPGHGLSDLPAAPLGPRQMSEWVAAYMEAAGLERAVVVGWSLGGAVSLALAAHHEGRVTGIVLVGPAALEFPLPLLLRPLRLYGVAELMPWIGGNDRARRAAMAGTFARSFRPSPDVVGRYFRAWRVAGRPAYMRRLLQKVRLGEIASYVDRVRVPAFVLHGEEDRIVPVRIAHQLGRLLDHAEIRTLPATGHAAHIERPEAVHMAISAAMEAAT